MKGTDTNFCTNCGAKLEDDSIKYCRNCGHKKNDINNNEKPKKKKSKIPIIIIIIFILLYMIGISSENENTNNESSNSTKQTTIKDNESNDSTNQAKQKENEDKKIDKTSIIYNNQGMLVKITDYEYKPILDRITITIYIENNTDVDTTYTINGDASIDGIMSEGAYFYQQVNAHTKATEQFYVYNLKEKGIDGESAKEMKFNFSIYQSENYYIYNRILDNQPITYTFR